MKKTHVALLVIVSVLVTAALTLGTTGYFTGRIANLRTPPITLPPITAAEIIQKLVVSREWPLFTGTRQSYSDVPPSNPYWRYIETAVDHELILPVTEYAPFNPARRLHKAEYSMLIHRAWADVFDRIEPAHAGTPELNNVPAWAVYAVRDLYQAGVYQVDFQSEQFVERAFVNETVARAKANLGGTTFAR